MSNLGYFVLVLAAVGFAGALPNARRPINDLPEETVIVPLEAQQQQQSASQSSGSDESVGGGAHIIIGGYGPPLDFGAPLVGGFGPQGFGDPSYPGLYPEHPAFAAPPPSLFSQFNPFSGAGAGGGFLSGLESGLALMRRQLATLLNSVPGLGGLAGGVTRGDGNTTSTTKVIDGHRITINETVYGNGFDGSVFKVRVVDVHPEKSDADADAGASPKDEAEDMGKQEEATTTDATGNTAGDTADESAGAAESGEKLSNDIGAGAEQSNEIELLPDEDIKVHPHRGSSTVKTPVSHGNPLLLDPTLVISEAARPETWESLEHLDGPEYEDILETNDVQLPLDFPHLPIDLSNDIAVNGWLADQPAFTSNPNTELVNVFGSHSEDSNGSVDRLRSLRSMPIK